MVRVEGGSRRADLVTSTTDKVLSCSLPHPSSVKELDMRLKLVLNQFAEGGSKQGTATKKDTTIQQDAILTTL